MIDEFDRRLLMIDEFDRRLLKATKEASSRPLSKFECRVCSLTIRGAAGVTFWSIEDLKTPP
jgi:hypothetical protein